MKSEQVMLPICHSSRLLQAFWKFFRSTRNTFVSRLSHTEHVAREQQEEGAAPLSRMDVDVRAQDVMTVSSEAQYIVDPAPKDLYEYLTNLVKQGITRYLAQEQIQLAVEQLPIDLRLSAKDSFGDYSMPVMPWASKQKLGRPPLKIAEDLAAMLREMNPAGIEEITATK